MSSTEYNKNPGTRDDGGSKNTTGRGATLKDVAARCGFGIGTVSIALRDPHHFPPDTTRRVQESAAALGYDPSRQQSARRLIMSRYGKQVVNHLVALVIPEQFYRATYYAMLFQGVLDVLTLEGFGLLVVTAQGAKPVTLPPSFTRAEVDGAIIMVGWDALQQTLQSLRAEIGFANRPVVSVMTAIPECSLVTTNAADGARQEVLHLAELGHQSMVYFRRPGGSRFGFHQDSLLEGYEQGCKDAGLDPKQALTPFDIDPFLWRIAFVAGDITRLGRLNLLEGGRRHPLVDWLRQRPQITAILAPNDPSAIAIRHILSVAGMNVPADYSLVGYDDTDALLDDRGHNQLTTVRLPLRTIGRRTARLMVDRISGKRSEDTEVIVSSRLIVRGTTAVRK